MKKLMVILGGGGHTEQMIKLLEQLGSRFEYLYVIPKDDIVSPSKIRIKGKVYRIKRATYPMGSMFSKIYGSAINFFQSFSLCLRERPYAILSSGPGTAVFISIIGKLLGSKIIFVESWSRVNRPSTSGKIIYKFADLFFVQWENLKKIYPRSKFAGRLA